MLYGTIGAGQVAQAFARKLIKAGYEVMLSNSRGPESLTPLIKEIGLGTKAGTVAEAAQADIVLLAVPWWNLQETLHALPLWNGRIVIDATNQFVNPELQIADLGGRTSSEIVADFLPGARVVKAFNALYGRYIEAEPEVEQGRRVLFYCGDDTAAKQECALLFKKMGFAPIDLGTLAEGGKMQQVGGPLAGLNLIQPTN